MSLEEHEIAKFKTFEIYDTIDFTPFFYDCDTIGELRSAMNEKYNYTELTNNDFMQGSFFNVISDGELINYLEKRYGNKLSFTEWTDYGIHFQY